MTVMFEPSLGSTRVPQASLESLNESTAGARSPNSRYTFFGKKNQRVDLKVSNVNFLSNLNDIAQGHSEVKQFDN